MKRATSIATPVAHLVGPGKIKVINQHLAFVAKDASAQRLDPKTLTTVFCYGPVGVTDDAFGVLFQNDIQVSWLTPGGNRFKGRLTRVDASTTMTRLLQYAAFLDSDWCREWAHHIVRAKIESQIVAARHYQRHGTPVAGKVIQQLQSALRQCDGSLSLRQIRGVEGASSAAWFGFFGQLFVPPWQFLGRTRRPPRDPVNALLSLGYTWLNTRLVARCEAAGLEVYLGGLHRYRPGRPSLACDLIEPLRVPAVDRWVLKMCNQKHIQPKDFVPENGGYRLQPDVFTRMLVAWEEYGLESGVETILLQHMDQLLRKLRSQADQLNNLIDDEDVDL